MAILVLHETELATGGFLVEIEHRRQSRHLGKRSPDSDAVRTRRLHPTPNPRIVPVPMTVYRTAE